MGGVENLIHVIVPYCVQRKGMKWYRKIAVIFIELAIYNTYIVWKKLNNFKNEQKIFREQLIKVFVMYHVHGTRNPQSGPRVHANLRNPLRLKGKHFIRYLRKRGNKETKELYTLQSDGYTKRYI